MLYIIGRDVNVSMSLCRNCCQQRCSYTNRQIKRSDLKFTELLPSPPLEVFLFKIWKLHEKTIWVILSQRKCLQTMLFGSGTDRHTARMSDNVIAIGHTSFTQGTLTNFLAISLEFTYFCYCAPMYILFNKNFQITQTLHECNIV